MDHTYKMIDIVFAIMQEELNFDTTGIPFELECYSDSKDQIMHPHRILIYLYGQYIGNIMLDGAHITFYHVYVRRGDNAIICKVSLSDPQCFSIIKERIIMSLSEIHRKKYNSGTIIV